jgi:hypothetical protein
MADIGSQAGTVSLAQTQDVCVCVCVTLRTRKHKKRGGVPGCLNATKDPEMSLKHGDEWKERSNGRAGFTV